MQRPSRRCLRWPCSIASVLAPMAGLASSAPKTTLREDLRALLRCPRELWLIYLATFFEYLGIFSFLPT